MQYDSALGHNLQTHSGVRTAISFEHSFLAVGLQNDSAIPLTSAQSTITRRSSPHKCTDWMRITTEGRTLGKSVKQAWSAESAAVDAASLKRGHVKGPSKRSPARAVKLRTNPVGDNSLSEIMYLQSIMKNRSKGADSAVRRSFRTRCSHKKKKKNPLKNNQAKKLC